MELMLLRIRIYIRHPSLSLAAPSPSFASDSLKKCTESSEQIINIVNHMRLNKTLDTSFTNVSLLFLATITVLYGFWENKMNSSEEENNRVKGVVDCSISILGIVVYQSIEII
jgi:hypothetical protein